MFHENPMGFNFEEARFGMVAEVATQGNQIIHGRFILPERDGAAQPQDLDTMRS